MSSRNEGNLLHSSDSQENPELAFGEDVGYCVVKQTPQDWELGSALPEAQFWARLWGSLFAQPLQSKLFPNLGPPGSF